MTVPYCFQDRWIQEMVSYLQADYLIIEGLQNAPVSKIVCAENTDQLDDWLMTPALEFPGLFLLKWRFKGLPVFPYRMIWLFYCSTIEAKCFDILPLAEPGMLFCLWKGLLCYGGRYYSGQGKEGVIAFWLNKQETPDFGWGIGNCDCAFCAKIITGYRYCFCE